MRSSSGTAPARASESSHTIADAHEQSFGGHPQVLSSIARMLWPYKTAANLAAATDCSVRAAEMYLGGQRDWSGDAIAAIVSEILKRHSMRNVRVKAK